MKKGLLFIALFVFLAACAPLLTDCTTLVPGERAACCVDNLGVGSVWDQTTEQCVSAVQVSTICANAEQPQHCCIEKQGKAATWDGTQCVLACHDADDQNNCCTEQNKDTPHIACVGEWQYINNGCAFVCAEG